MGYILFAFVAKKQALLAIADHYNTAKIVTLEQGIGIIPMTEELYDDINMYKTAKDVAPFTSLNMDIRDKILELTGADPIAYVEAEYHGGQGDQSSILWKNGIIAGFYPNTEGAINAILKSLDVKKSHGLDEFDSIGLGRHRNMEDRINES